MARFTFITEQSVVAIYARSNVGPIRWEGTGLRGGFEAELVRSTISPTAESEGHLELPLDGLRSGNSVYDAELMRRLEARRHPVATAVLRFVDTAGHHNRFQVQGELTLHGVTRSISGALELEVAEDSTIHVFGEKVVDIRDFNIPSPSMLMLRIYPDVRVRMRLVAAQVPISPEFESEAVKR